MRLIDADAVIEKCWDWYVEEGSEEGFIGTLKSLIDGQPTVDAAPVVHGRWDERHVDYASDCAIDEVQALRCSVCRRYLTTPYMYSFSEYKFCPNCGAKMDGEGDA